jgi:hypothetical protein
MRRVRVKCPECASGLDVSSKELGGQVVCARCHGQFVAVDPRVEAATLRPGAVQKADAETLVGD